MPIKSKSDLRYYLLADEIAVEAPSRGLPRIREKFMNRIWRFERYLRKAEYYTNCRHSMVGRFWAMCWRQRVRLCGVKMGFEIPINVFGPGLSIAHRGLLIVNPAACVGEDCRIHNGVTIGTDLTHSDHCPSIGNDVFIGPGAQIFGPITIANNIAIGANAVVSKSFLEENISIGGVPARKISAIGTLRGNKSPTMILKERVERGEVRL